MKAVSYYVVIEKIKEKKPENKGFVISEHQDKTTHIYKVK